MRQVVAVACSGLKGVVEMVGPAAISANMADVMRVTNNLLLEKVWWKKHRWLAVVAGRLSRSFDTGIGFFDTRYISKIISIQALFD